MNATYYSFETKSQDECIYGILTPTYINPDNFIRISIVHQNIQSLCDVDWSKYIKKDNDNDYYELDCSNNNLSDLEGMPSNIKVILCHNNKLISLKGCPQNVFALDCSSNQLLNLQHCSPNVKYLNCSGNYLTNLLDCPSSVIHLNCMYNKITSLEGVSPKINNLCDFNYIRVEKMLCETKSKDAMITLLFQEITNLKTKMINLENALKEKDEFIEHLKYAPIGYLQAKEDFDNLKNLN